MRRTFLNVIVLSFIMPLALGALVAPVSAQGNSEAAHLCQDDGYLEYTDADENGFKNAGQCTRYAARGGALVPIVVGPDLVFDGSGISGTGFTANTPLTNLVTTFTPSGEVQDILTGETRLYGPMSTDATGAFSTEYDQYNWCYKDDKNLEVTATDAAGVTHTETFDLNCD